MKVGNCGPQHSSAPQQSKGASGQKAKVGGSGEKCKPGGSDEKAQAKAAGVPYGQFKKQMQDGFESWQSHVHDQMESMKSQFEQKSGGGGILSGIFNWMFGNHDNFLNSTQHSTPTAVANGQKTQTPAPGVPVDLGNPAAAGHAKDLPFISQYSPDGADANYKNGAENCGPALLASIAKANGKQVPGMTDAQLVSAEMKKAGTTGDGTTGNGMMAALADMGMQTAASPGADMNWINSQLQQGHEVIANGDFYSVPGHTDPSLVAGHYIAISEVSNGVYKVTDPADPNVHQMTSEQLASFINQHPEGGFTISAW